MHDVITHQITILIAKNEILRCDIPFAITLLFSSSHRVRLCPLNRLTNFSAFPALSCASRTNRDRITLLLVQGMRVARRKEGREGGKEGRKEGEGEGEGEKPGSDSFSLFSVSLPSIENLC